MICHRRNVLSRQNKAIYVALSASVSLFLLMLSLVIPANLFAQPQGIVELVNLRTRYSQTYDLGNGQYMASFSSGPIFTEVNNQWVDYDFQDMGNHYRVQHPWASVEFYDYYTKVYSENWTDVKIYDDRWTVEVQSFAGPIEKWSDIGFWGIVRSYQTVPDGIKLIRTGQTNLGIREEVYYFRNGAPCKVEITQHSTSNEVIRFVWKPSGIVAASEVITSEDIGSYSGKANGLRYQDVSNDTVYNLRWYDALELYDSLGLSDNITIIAGVTAQGRKADISFGNFPISAGGSMTLDPETYYPDASPESNSVDGHVYDEELGGQDWSVLIALPGDTANDSSTTLFCSYQGADSVSNKWEYCVRGITLFNTAALPDSAVIVSANLSLYGKSKQANLPYSDHSVNIYSSAPASDTSLAAGDYDSLGTIAFSTVITYTSWNTAGYNIFQLNANGKAAISTTGVSKFGMRDPKYDVAGSQPAWASSQTNNIAAYSADQGSNQPRLTVIYALSATVTSDNSTSITINQATLSGNITDVGSDNCTTRGFEWGVISGVYTDNVTESGNYGVGIYSLNATSLLSSTLYYWRAMAYNPAGWVYGSELSFNTISAAINSPTNLVLTDLGCDTINMTWAAGASTTHTLVRIKRNEYPESITDGEEAYFGDNTTANKTGLDLELVTYYVRAWGYASGNYSANYTEAYIGGEEVSESLDSISEAIGQIMSGQTTVTSQILTLAIVAFIIGMAYWQHHIILYVLSGMVSIAYGLNTAIASSQGATNWIAGVAIAIFGVYTLYRAVIMSYGFFRKEKAG